MSVAAHVDGSGQGLRLKLPATSANLGPGFDTLALALALYLEVDVEQADQFSIRATGRNVDVCSRLEGNLLLQVYRDTVLSWTGSQAPPLALRMQNGIPLGMGCGSSAASRLAGVAMASHFGALRWSSEQVLAEAARLEGHPDNAAACWMGGFVASAWNEPPAGETDLAQASPSLTAAPGGFTGRRSVAAISIAPPSQWHALLVLPPAPLATPASRAVLPDQYSRRDVVLNLQRLAVLTGAFAAGRGDLLRTATADSLHQPFRSAVCPLLPLLLPLAGQAGILSVTLSGAGPAVLLLLQNEQAVAPARRLVRESVSADSPAVISEMIDCTLETQRAAVVGINSQQYV